MDGVLLFNKPILWTSHDAVDFIRRGISQKSVGHAGTLDPLATGLLILLLGKATKWSEKLSDLDKDYSGSMTLGVRTDTQDMDGRILERRAADDIDAEAVSRVFSQMTGDQKQYPPAYSAIKKDGKKLYEWAREGVAVEARSRDIFIKRFDLLRFDLPEAVFSVTCSKGTYVRSLCDRVGEMLGCGAALSTLVRTRIGNFHLKEAVNEGDVRRMSLEEIEKRLIKEL